MTEPADPDEVVILAREIATRAHAGQFDKTGRPYIEHPEAVSEFVAEDGGSTTAIAAALLHDVIEDTDETAESLLEQGVPQDTVDIVIAMTRTPEVPPEDYYAGLVQAGEEAVAVKRADIRHNTLPERTEVLDEHTRRRLAAKYEKALRHLSEE